MMNPHKVGIGIIATSNIKWLPKIHAAYERFLRIRQELFDVRFTHRIRVRQNKESGSIVLSFYSVLVWPVSLSIAAFMVCQARDAHFVLTGNCHMPENTFSFPR